MSTFTLQVVMPNPDSSSAHISKFWRLYVSWITPETIDSCNLGFIFPDGGKQNAATDASRTIIQAVAFQTKSLKVCNGSLYFRQKKGIASLFARKASISHGERNLFKNRCIECNPCNLTSSPQARSVCFFFPLPH